MLKNTETQQKIDEKKKRYFFKYFSFRLIGAIQDTDVTTPRKKKKKEKMQFVYTQIHWCKKIVNRKKT